MSNSKSVLLEQIESHITPALVQHEMELVNLEFVHEHGQWILRLYLDKKGGITLDDCAEMSNRLGSILDATDLIKQSYSLEVSSPGVYRPLRKEADYLRFKGERVEVSLYAPINGRRRFKGKIAAVDGGVLVVEEEPGMQHSVPLADVAKANLDPELDI